MGEKYVLGVDFGSTTLSAKIYNQSVECLAFTSAKVPYSALSHVVEILPDELWSLFVDVVKATVIKSGLEPSQITCCGLTFQRSTLILWDRTTGKPFCNLISWQDTQCAQTVAKYNHSWTMKAINVIGYLLYSLLRYKKFLLMKILKFSVNHGSMKLVWMIETNSQVKEAMRNDNLCVGFLDTWCLWRLSKGRLYVTEPTNAVGTGMWDPFTREWSSILPLLMGIPTSIFPEVLYTSCLFCDLDEDVFGAPIPLTAIVADVAASSFGQCCFESGQVSCVMGTGCIMTVNTGSYVHASISGLYPQLALGNENEFVFSCEGLVLGVAASLEWAGNMELFGDVNESASIAQSVKDSGGVYFVPGFFGLSAPHVDPHAGAGLIGVKRDTKKAHILRAVLEAVAFSFYELYEISLVETNIPFCDVIKACGGISNNDFVLTLMSALAECRIERSNDTEMSILGAVYLAGLESGVWRRKEDLLLLQQPRTTFSPNSDLRKQYLPLYGQWKEAVKRFLNWNS